MRYFGQLFQNDLGSIEPFLVGTRSGQLGLDIGIVDDLACFEIDQQHLARLQPPFLNDLFFRYRQDTHLRCHDDRVIVGNQVARRTQSVAVEGRADLPSIREGDGGGSVPGLHQGGMVFVKGTPLVIHQRVTVPGFRDQQHHRVRQRIAAQHEQFERIVETGGVRLAFADQRPNLIEILAERVRLHRIAPRVHPVQIAAQSIDFAVMANHPEGVGERPSRERIGREPLMHQGNRGLDPFVGKVGIEWPNLIGQNHAFVTHRPRRQRRDVKIGRILAQCSRFARRPLANDE